MLLLILTVIEAAAILWLLWDRWQKIRAISERRRDIRVLKRLLDSERVRNENFSSL